MIVSFKLIGRDVFENSPSDSNPITRSQFLGGDPDTIDTSSIGRIQIGYHETI